MSDFLLLDGRISRRVFLGGAAAGAAGVGLSGLPALAQSVPAFGSPASMYAAVVDGGHKLPAIPIEKLDKRFVRQIVIDPTSEKNLAPSSSIRRRITPITCSMDARRSATASASARPASTGSAAR